MLNRRVKGGGRRQRRARPSDLGNLRYGEIMRVFRHRGVSDPAQAYAALDARLTTWTADAIGSAIELTFEEKIRLDVRTIRCCDRDRAFVENFYRERRKFRDRDRKRKEAREGSLPARAGAMLEYLRARGPATLSDIAKALEQHPAFLKATGEMLGPDAMRQAMSVNARKLTQRGLVTLEKKQIQGGAFVAILTPAIVENPSISAVTGLRATVTGDGKPPHTQEAPING